MDKDCDWIGKEYGGFNYVPHFQNFDNTYYDETLSKLGVFWAELEKVTQEGRLSWGQQQMFFKLIEELGEYSSAKLGDKPVKESPRQELVDVIMTAISLFILEGGSMKMLAEYGMKKLEKVKSKWTS